MSTSFHHVHHKYRNVYTYNKKKENKLCSKFKQTTTSIMEIDHYQDALKWGLFSTEKEKNSERKEERFQKHKKLFTKKVEDKKDKHMIAMCL